jgi:GTP-binding protein EngB required for normal cell division
MDIDHKSKELVDHLRDLIGNLIELPQIVVVGDTSSGKSSVLSTLSTFEFPSASDLCTRCPIQLSMSNEETTSIRIYLKKVNGTEKIDEREAKDKAELINLMKEYMEKNTNDENSEFSENIIVINAKGKDFPNLTLIDLPGIIRTSKNKTNEEKEIQKIKNIITGYIKQNRTVILAVIAANVDLHNQEVLKFAFEADKNGDRTLAVLTKPDQKEKGTEKSIKKIASNQDHIVKLGWYTIYCRDKQTRDKGVSIEDFWETEKDFYKNNEPWNELLDEGILGRENLKNVLTSHLKERIKDQLPDVFKEIKKKLLEKQISESLVSKSGPNDRYIWS